MTIEERDFRLIPINGTTPKFDLELLYTINPKGKESRQEFKNVAYSIGLDYAVKKIAHYRVSCKHKDEAVTLLTYFKEFKEELDSIKRLLNYE